MPVLDRLVEFDERSRQYPIRTLVATKQPRSYTWSCATVLNQGDLGACVGFSWAQELAARPKVHPVDYAYALALYRKAQTLDQWEGTDYEGSSVIAGAKAVQQTGLLTEYRWAFGLDDLILAVGYAGPVVLGVNWYSGMSNPDDGYVHLNGRLQGGHAILANGVSLRRSAVRLHNSWGRGWGSNGEAWISFADLNRLLHEDGECCVPVGRR